MNNASVLSAASVVLLDQFCMVTLLAMFFVAYHVSRQSPSKMNSLIGVITVVYSVSILANDVWVFGEAGAFHNLFVQNLCMSVYFSALGAAVGLWPIFACLVIDLPIRKYKKWFPFLFLPAILMIAFAVTAPFNHYLFYFNEAGKYVRGPLYGVTSAITYGYFGLLAVVTVFGLIFTKGKRRWESVSLISGVGCVLLFYTLQFLTSLECSTLGVATALIFYFSYVVIRTLNEQRRKLFAQQGELERTLAMAQSANRAKTTFLNNMSHDIRTPMNAIIGFTGMANAHIDDTEAVKRYLGKIESASDHLLSLVNDVLDMSRIESGKVSLSEHGENLNDILGEISDLAEEGADKKNITFVMSVDVERPLVRCDKLRLKQILLNLLSNSIKYTPEGGRVSFTVKEETGTNEIGKYTFCVADNGIGMSPEFLKTLFEPFSRAQSSTVSGVQGTGLGMAITKNLVTIMAGTIDVRSEENKGTETTVCLEFSVCDCVKEQKPVTPEVEIRFSGKKVLLVEDNELNREIAVDLLTEEGFDLDTAADGTEAVEKMKNAEAGRYDLILMDIQMPIMDGYRATRTIRAMESEYCRTVPIVAMTANAFEEDRKKALSAGMNEHIAKPIDVIKMKATIAAFLR